MTVKWNGNGNEMGEQDCLCAACVCVRGGGWMACVEWRPSSAVKLHHTNSSTFHMMTIFLYTYFTRHNNNVWALHVFRHVLLLVFVMAWANTRTYTRTVESSFEMAFFERVKLREHPYLLTKNKHVQHTHTHGDKLHNDTNRTVTHCPFINGLKWHKMNINRSRTAWKCFFE